MVIHTSIGHPEGTTEITGFAGVPAELRGPSMPKVYFKATRSHVDVTERQLLATVLAHTGCAVDLNIKRGFTCAPAVPTPRMGTLRTTEAEVSRSVSVGKIHLKTSIKT